MLHLRKITNTLSNSTIPFHFVALTTKLFTDVIIDFDQQYKSSQLSEPLFLMFVDIEVSFLFDWSTVCICIN